MSWELWFYRRVGQPPLLIEELDPLFERMPRFTRVPPRAEDPLAEREVCFRYRNPITGAAFEFTFQSLPEEEGGEEDPGRADFPYEETALRLRLPPVPTPEVAQEAMPIAAEVCLHLDLLARDPQVEQELPGRPNVDALIRSYAGYQREVQETLAYLHVRSRRSLRIALVLLVLALVLLLFSFGTGR